MKKVGKTKKVDRIKQVKIIRYSLFFSGLLILTLGARILLFSGMGTGGIDAFAFGVSERWGLSIGTWFNILGISEIIIGCILRKCRLQIAPIICAILVGLLFDFWGVILFNNLRPLTTEVIKGVVFLIGLVITPLGTTLYILPGVTTGAMDFLMISIKNRFHCSLLVARTILEAVFLISACLVQGPIGVGTIMIMLLFGTILQFYYGNAKKIIYKAKLADILPRHEGL